MPLESSHRMFFDHHADNWDHEECSEKISTLHNIMQGLNFLSTGNILDIGAGTGILVPIIKCKTAPENYLIELDISLEMLKINRHKWIDTQWNLVQLNSDALKIPFKKESFTGIICFAVLPHLANKKSALKECHRVLAGKGKLLILHLMSSELLNRYHKDVGGAVENDHLESVERLSRQLRGIGFQILKAEEKEDLHLILAAKK
ncbi:MAG: class I SAM-dependent methyltransferase [Calditrichota bacterium]|jgi:ubiquinone/menaquinone biosynthesis C-methylase UbiE